MAKANTVYRYKENQMYITKAFNYKFSTYKYINTCTCIFKAVIFAGGGNLSGFLLAKINNFSAIMAQIIVL